MVGGRADGRLLVWRGVHLAVGALHELHVCLGRVGRLRHLLLLLLHG